jgi:hypothetical protein
MKTSKNILETNVKLFMYEYGRIYPFFSLHIYTSKFEDNTNVLNFKYERNIDIHLDIRYMDIQYLIIVDLS